MVLQAVEAESDVDEDLLSISSGEPISQPVDRVLKERIGFIGAGQVVLQYCGLNPIYSSLKKPCSTKLSQATLSLTRLKMCLPFLCTCSVPEILVS